MNRKPGFMVCSHGVSLDEANFEQTVTETGDVRIKYTGQVCAKCTAEAFAAVLFAAREPPTGNRPA